MPKKVVSKAKPKAASPKTTPKTAPKVTPKDAEAKRDAQVKQDGALRAAVVKRVVKGDETLGAVAKDLKITSGKAAFLIMQHRVEKGEVAAIEAKSESALINQLAAARAKGDEFSSWGWLAARSGKSEGFIKGKLAEAGKYAPRAENIATVRASKAPKKAAAPKAAAGKKRTKGNA